MKINSSEAVFGSFTAKSYELQSWVWICSILNSVISRNWLQLVPSVVKKWNVV